MPERDLIVTGVRAIAAYLYGEANRNTVRRVRTLIERDLLRVKRTAGRIEARQSWLDAAYAEPDPPPTNGAAQPKVIVGGDPSEDTSLPLLLDLGECARPSCTERVIIPIRHHGRRPKYCEEHRWR